MGKHKSEKFTYDFSWDTPGFFNFYNNPYFIINQN